MYTDCALLTAGFSVRYFDHLPIETLKQDTDKPGVSKLFLVNNLALVNIFCFPKSHFQHKSPKDSKQPGVSKLFSAYIKVY